MRSKTTPESIREAYRRVKRRLGYWRRPNPAEYLALPCIVLTGIGATLQIDKDLVAASATPLVLAILSEGESYGYAILKRVRELSDGEIEWSDGMLYPLLHRLHRQGHVTAHWLSSLEGRRRRYYSITDNGRSALAEQQRQWATVTNALDDLWQQIQGRTSFAEG